MTLKKLFRNSVAVMLGITISATAVANASYILPKSASPFIAYATQERYYNFIIPALSGDIASDMATIGEAQVGRTTSDLGYSEHWCANFVCDIATILGQRSAIPTNGGCRSLYNAVLNAGGYTVTTPQRGDLVFYYCTSCAKYMHVGIMKNSSTSVEGNLGGAVHDNVSSYLEGTEAGAHSTKNGIVQKLFVRPNYYNSGLNEPVATYDKQTYSLGDTVNITWTTSSGSGFSHYWVVIYDSNGTQVYNQSNFSSNVFSYTPSAIGTYNVEIYATPKNSPDGTGSKVNYSTFSVGCSFHSMGNWNTILSPTCTESGYETRYCTSCPYYESNETPATGHRYTDTVVAPTFDEQGYTLHDCDNCDYSYTDSFTDKLVNLSVVSGFANTGKSSTTLTLGWTADNSADGYMVQQFTGTKWATIADIKESSTTSYKVYGLTPGTAYKFRIRAYAENGDTTIYGSYTSTLTANTKMTAVKGFTSPSESTSAIRLSWTKNAYADGYIIERYNGTKWEQIADIADNATVTYKVTGLYSGTAYKFRMKAYSITKYGETVYGDKTATITINTQASSVSGFGLKSRSSSAIRLKWTKNAYVDGYIIEQYTNGKWKEIADIDSFAITEYKVTELKASTTYKFRMKAYAVTKYGEKTYSAYTSTLSKTTNPSTVSGLKVKSKAQTAIRLAWEKNTSADGYLIEQYKSGKWVQIAKIKDNATLNYRIDGLTKATTYKFRVKTYKEKGSTTLYSDYISVSGTTL